MLKLLRLLNDNYFNVEIRNFSMLITNKKHQTIGITYITLEEDKIIEEVAEIIKFYNKELAINILKLND